MSTGPIAQVSHTPVHPCPSCGREWGGGIACQFCDQVEGLPVGIHLSSPARRFGGYVLEGVLVAFTLGIGWFVWSLIVYGRGQTPAKQVLGMRVVTLRTGEKASWGRMFVREVVAKPLVGLVCALTLGIAYFWLVWDNRNQELWDKVVGSIVVNDSQRQLVGIPAPQGQQALQSPRQRMERDPMPFPSHAPVVASPDELTAPAAAAAARPELDAPAPE